MRAVAAPGRWVWGVSGLATAVALAVPGVHLLTSSWHEQPPPQATVTRTVIVPQPVTSLTVGTSGTPVQVVARPVRQVRITETFWYDKQDSAPPPVMPSVSNGYLALTDQECSDLSCSVGFTVIVPKGVAATVTTEGGPVSISGTATTAVQTQGGSVTVSGTGTTTVDSGGGPVDAARIGGPLTVTAEGGWLRLDGLTGALHADTGGGPLDASNISTTTASVQTEGGYATISFAVPPDSVSIDSGGGPATLAVPGGPYAVTADSGGGPETLDIATNPAAHQTISISSEGGALLIRP